MPSPRENETEDDFINRCMGDEEMNQKHPDRKERYAVCKSFWDNKGVDMSDVMKEEDAD
jgi:hypothetical protein